MRYSTGRNGERNHVTGRPAGDAKQHDMESISEFDELNIDLMSGRNVIIANGTWYLTEIV